MSDDKFMLISLDDPKMKGLSDVLGNKSCKRIVDYLAENVEASEKDLADALSMPINTVEYNLKKLLDSGLVQKRNNFFWSRKGKKIAMYELSNKSIIISPKKAISEKVKSLLPSVMAIVAGSVLIYAYEKMNRVSNVVRETFVSSPVAEKSVGIAIDSAQSAGDFAVSESAIDAVSYISSTAGYAPSNTWMWFMGGALIALLIFSIVNWRKL